MREAGKSGLLAVVAFCAMLAGCGDSKPKPAMDHSAREITDYAARRAGCNHWGGEDGYDAARKAEIARAATALRCGQIDADEAALLKRYGGQPELLQQIRAAKDKTL